MTKITFDNGKPVLRGGKVGVGQGCCCGEPECPCGGNVQLGEVSGVREPSIICFPKAASCAQLVFGNTWPGELVTIRTTRPGVPPLTPIYDQFLPAGTQTLCLPKVANDTFMLIYLPNVGASFPFVTITITCNTCSCNPLP